MSVSVLLLVPSIVLWAFLSFRYPRQASWVLLLWVPIQGWIQLNLLGDSNGTVLFYEYQMVLIYLGLTMHWFRRPDAWKPPRIFWLVVPFFIWFMLLFPRSLARTGWLLPLVSLRTNLLPLGMVWVGSQAFTNLAQLRRVAVALSAEMVVIGLLAALQYAALVTSYGSVVDVPVGYGVAGTLRPPATFSSPGQLGMYVLAMMPLGIAFVGFEAPRWQRLVFAAGLVATAIALTVNSQRASILLVLLMVPCMGLMNNQSRILRRLTIALTIVVIGLVIGVSVIGEGLTVRVASIGNDLQDTLRDIPLERMQDALRTPLVGVGLGTASPGTSRLDVNMVNQRPAESFMAALVFEAGVPGLLFHYVFMTALLLSGWRVLRQARVSEVKLLASAIVVYEIAMWLQSWSYDPLHYLPSRVTFWFWGGVLLALPRLSSVGQTVARAGHRSTSALVTAVRKCDDAAVRR